MTGAGGLIPLAEAQTRLFALARPRPIVSVPLAQTPGHALASPLIARRSQPAADLSAMDGYAMRWSDMPGPWQVAGESAAGRPFAGALASGHAVRISTGAMVPDGADTVLVQEDCARQGDLLTLTGEGPEGRSAHIRRAGHDFAIGSMLAQPGMAIDARLIALAAMAGHGELPVFPKLRIAVLSTGDELVEPGQPLPSLAHIPASNGAMLAAMLSGLPADVTVLPLVPDRLDAIAEALAQNSTADIIVTTGGASVGDHDLVQPALIHQGGTVDFWRIAMRPGKPVMVGKLGDSIVLGLPGNPVSAYVTALMLLLPLVRTVAGFAEPLPTIQQAKAGVDFPSNGVRQDFMRTRFSDGALVPVSNQDSGALASLLVADALVIRAAHCGPTATGEPLDYIALHQWT